MIPKLCAILLYGLSCATHGAFFPGSFVVPDPVAWRLRAAPSREWRRTATVMLGSHVPPEEETLDSLGLQQTGSLSSLSRRKAILSGMAGQSAEAAWRRAVSTAAIAIDADRGTSGILPPGTIEQIESGRAVVIPNWLTPSETTALRNDVKSTFEDGHFKNFILSRNPNKADNAANDRWIMPSFSSTAKDGPFVDPTVGNFAIRQKLKVRMAEIKAVLASQMQDRPTLADEVQQMHEMEYLRYGEGALLQRHTDEHHVELKRPNGSRLPKKPNASRRSVTWMVYLNEDWDGTADGGQLRLHERARPSTSYVGARGPDLQVGWLKATSNQGEEPVFLDPLRPGPENENCILYTCDAAGKKRDLSRKPFANIALYLGGGDVLARKLMMDDREDAARLHLIDAPKSLVSSLMTPPSDPAGEDGGERVRDIVPKAGTLVMFDSVSLPHEVLQTNRERFGVQGWFHEKLYM